MLYIKLFIEREKSTGQSAPECPFKGMVSCRSTRSSCMPYASTSSPVIIIITTTITAAGAGAGAAGAAAAAATATATTAATTTTTTM